MRERQFNAWSEKLQSSGRVFSALKLISFAAMKALFLLSLPILLLAQEPYVALTKFSPLYTPDSGSIISPNGTYFTRIMGKGEFEVVELKTGSRFLRSEYLARNPPNQKFSRPTHFFFTFSLDEKFLAVDNYVFNDTIAYPLAHWVEIWNLRSLLLDGYLPSGFASPPLGSLSDYYSPSPFRRHFPKIRIQFSPGNDEILLLYPYFARFTFPGLVEINGEFDLIGVDRDPSLQLSFRPVGTPLLMKDRKALINLGGNLYLFHDYPASLRRYTKIGPATGDFLEVSGDGRWVASGGSVYNTGYSIPRAWLPGPVFFSGDGRRALSNGVLFDCEMGFTKLPPLFPGKGNIVPSSTREHLFLRDSVEMALFVFSFSSGKLLQKIGVGPNEAVLRNTDDGKLLILKDSFSGRIRLFERR